MEDGPQSKTASDGQLDEMLQSIGLIIRRELQPQSHLESLPVCGEE